MVITWTAPTGAPDSTYQIFRSTTNSWDVTPEYLIGTSSSLAFTDINPPPNVQAFYAVVSVRQGVQIGTNREGNWTGTDRNPTQVIARPFNSNLIGISWEDNSVNELGFRIERKIVGTFSWTLVEQVPESHEIGFDENVQPGVEYLYRVSAVYNSPLLDPLTLTVGSTSTRPASSYSGTILVLSGRNQYGSGDEPMWIFADILREIDSNLGSQS